MPRKYTISITNCQKFTWPDFLSYCRLGQVSKKKEKKPLESVKKVFVGQMPFPPNHNSVKPELCSKQKKM